MNEGADRLGSQHPPRGAATATRGQHQAAQVSLASSLWVLWGQTSPTCPFPLLPSPSLQGLSSAIQGCPGAEDSCLILNPSGQVGRREGVRPAEGHAARLWWSWFRPQPLAPRQRASSQGSQDAWLGFLGPLCKHQLSTRLRAPGGLVFAGSFFTSAPPK